MPAATLSRVIYLYQDGHTDKALSCLEEVKFHYVNAKETADILYNFFCYYRGLVEFHEKGDYDRASDFYDLAITPHESLNESSFICCPCCYPCLIKDGDTCCCQLGYIGKGDILGTQGELEGAAEWYKKAASLYPPNFRDEMSSHIAHFRRGIAMEKLGNYEEALNCYSASLQSTRPSVRYDCAKRLHLDAIWGKNRVKEYYMKWGTVSET